MYYSMYGHVEKLAYEIKKGATFVEGVDTTLRQVWIIKQTFPFYNNGSSDSSWEGKGLGHRKQYISCIG